MTIIILSNGKKVANFSSPHAFTFTDGSILPAVSNEEAERLKVTFHEDESPNGDVKLSFSLSDAVLEEVDKYLNLWHNAEVYHVYCPLPMIQALKERSFDVINSPFRSIRIEDRIQKLVSINKQCI